MVAMWMTVAAFGGKRPVEAGVYATDGIVLTVGKKAKTLQWNDEPASKVVAGAPYALTTEHGRTPMVAAGGATWFPSAVLAGDDLVTTHGWYRWDGGACTPRDEASEPVVCAFAGGTPVVDGDPLFERAPDVWTSTAIPAFRGADAAESRRLAHDLFVDDVARASLGSSSGEWWSEDGSQRHVFTGGTWSENDGPARVVAPLAPCLVEVVDEDGVSYAEVWWSDGRRAATWKAAVTVGDTVWACDGQIVERYRRGACEAFSFLAGAAPGEIGEWRRSSCVGTAEEPAGITDRTEVPGLLTPTLLGRVNPYPE